MVSNRNFTVYCRSSHWGVNLNGSAVVHIPVTGSIAVDVQCCDSAVDVKG